MKKELELKAKDLINGWLKEGHDLEMIAYALCDGQALENLGFTDDDQLLIEEAYKIVQIMQETQKYEATKGDSDEETLGFNRKNHTR